jgi:hypothetical protein
VIAIHLCVKYLLIQCFEINFVVIVMKGNLNELYSHNSLHLNCIHYFYYRKAVGVY